MENTYQIEIEKNMLVLKTMSFKAEKGSVLHSGIYNRELAASLTAGAIVLAIGFFLASRYRLGILHFIASLVIFILLFLFFRAYVYRKQVLEVVLDKKTSTVSFFLKNIIKRLKASYPLSEFSGFRQNHIAISPENPDGIQIVEKIALQHGTVIPGFGETVEFYTVELGFKNGVNEMIFSSKYKSKADDVVKKIKDFLEI